MPSQTMPFFSRLRHSTAVERRPVGCLFTFGFFRLPRGVPWSCNQTHTNLRWRWPVWNPTPFVMDEENSGRSTLQKRRRYPVGIFPATMRTFTKEKALSEQGRGAAWHVWINTPHGRGTAWERHGRGMLCLNRPLLWLASRGVWAGTGCCTNWIVIFTVKRPTAIRSIGSCIC